MESQIKSCIMYREQLFTFKIFECFNGVFREYMNISPALIVSASFQKCHIKRPKDFTNFTEAIKVTRISAEKEPEIIRQDDPRRP